MAFLRRDNYDGVDRVHAVVVVPVEENGGAVLPRGEVMALFAA